MVRLIHIWFLKKGEDCGLKLIFPSRRWCGSYRGSEKVMWLCGYVAMWLTYGTRRYMMGDVYS